MERRSLKRTKTIRSGADRRRFKKQTTARGLRSNKLSLLRSVTMPTTWTSDFAKVAGPFPTSAVTTINFTQRFTVNPPTGANSASVVYRLNDVYAPDGTATTQPRGWDELIQLYKKATVLGCGYKVSYSGGGPGTADQVIVGTRVTQTAAASTNFRDMIELPRTKYRLLADADAGPNIGVLSGYQDMKAFFGNDVKSETEFECEELASPANLCHLHITAAGVDGSGDASAVRGIVELRYYVQFKELRKLNAS